VPLAFAGRERRRVLGRARPDPHPAERPHRQHRRQVALRLLAGPQDRQVAGVGAGQQPGRQATDRGGADGGDLRPSRIATAAVLGLEQQHQAEVGENPAAGLFGTAQHLQAEALRSAR